MSDLRNLWAQGVRHIQYPNGHKTELRMLSCGGVYEFPLETKEEARDREIITLCKRIKSDKERLAELEGQWY